MQPKYYGINPKNEYYVFAFFPFRKASVGVLHITSWVNKYFYGKYGLNIEFHNSCDYI